RALALAKAKGSGKEKTNTASTLPSARSHSCLFTVLDIANFVRDRMTIERLWDAAFDRFVSAP
ncbi:MAG TPA: hypothetical protein VJS43_12030, partial [Candidatus Acidoferrales bacterium]|nr:hypothetical protein [Candidatus Acidoferrales bacterium]